ncbi:hypothetical protein GBAR_LOCUS29538 [Geodia barretti]|uniref:Death domain-containing protein n=1 Tax=Geodia barretti TaxID=519541 RepID=A0AA35TT76_GEOBA|nr:hypothetical protein GBAR_LOCUS29538 [Geodia barretti]
MGVEERKKFLSIETTLSPTSSAPTTARTATSTTTPTTVPTTTSTTTPTTVPTDAPTTTVPPAPGPVVLGDLITLSTSKRDIRILKESAVKFKDIGTFLLSDDTGARVITIANTAHGDQVETVRTIYIEWMREVEDHSWKKLIKCFRDVQLNSLARDLEVHFGLTSPSDNAAESATPSLSSSSSAVPPTSQPCLSVSAAPASSTTATTTTNTPVSESSTVSTTTASVPSPSLSSPPVSSTTTNTTTNTPAINEKKKEDDVISDRDLAVIARHYLKDWEKLRPFLRLSRAQKKEIARSYSRDYELQKQECLEVWKEEMGREATYQALISAAEEAGDQQLPDNIRDMLEKT